MSTRLLALVLIIGVAGAACSGGSSRHVASLAGGTATTSAPSAPSASSASSTPSGALQYVACLRAHGATNVPEPQAPPDGQKATIVLPASITGTPQFARAAAACKSLAPHGLVRPDITPQQQQDYLKAADCMRAHGINGFPDPTISGNQVSFEIPPGMDTASSQFLAAETTCRKLIPPGLPYSS